MNNTTSTPHTWRHKDCLGKRFGHLVVTKRIGSNGAHILWEAACDCGAVKTLKSSGLTRKKRTNGYCSHQCPLLSQRIRAQRKTHGKSHHKLYAIWRSMIDRCRLSTHQAFRNYGGRGIRVCQEWQDSFEAFWNDMAETWKPGLCLDRRNNDGNYTPANCHWVSYKENARNTRAAKIPGWALDKADSLGVARSTLGYRIAAGMPEALWFEAPNSGAKYRPKEGVKR